LWTGLRQGELYNLEKKDVHLDEQVPWLRVRFGSEDGPVKQQRNGQTRVRDLFLFPIAADLRRACSTMPKSMRNSAGGLVFPNRFGARRYTGEPSWWPRIKKLAKLPKYFRWHDLRHTCASSLVAGWWGRPWRLEEVQVYMAHSDISVTQRYAVLAPSELKRAIKRTSGQIGVQLGYTELAKSLSHLRDLNSRPTVYEGVSLDRVRTREPCGKYRRNMPKWCL
jgi:integrase